MAEVMKLGLPVIEDAAHAVDSKIGDAYCGSIGDVGIYSFDAVKNLVMGEGGAVTTRDPKNAERARLLRYCGIGKSGFEASTETRIVGGNTTSPEFFPKLLVSDINAGIGLAQLRKLDQLQAARKRMWNAYQDAFKDQAG